MSQPNRCPECGAELPTGDTEGLCPKCLMGVGLESQDGFLEPSGGDASTTTAHPRPGSFLPPEPAELSPHFPQLEIEELLGHGGMGAVYRARQTKLDRLVALKIIKPESADDPAFAERFNREARTLARLNHPHIVAVHDFGEAGELYYFLMEYVDGANLRQLLEGRQLKPEQALAVVPQICEALQFAHDEGIVHRDIKPENILLDRKGRVKIADFGLAKLAGGEPDDFTLTGTHQVMGTPRYMAPEQMEGSHQVDHRADIYSLGVVFYEMLTGELPLGHFDPPSHKARIDAQLDGVVLKTLAREPDRRYQQASQVKTDLESLSVARDSVATDDVAEQRATFKPSLADVDFEDARRQVQGPAMGLIVAGILNLLPLALAVVAVVGIVFQLSIVGGHGSGGIVRAAIVFILLMFLNLPAGLVLIIGGLKMRKLETYGLAMTASILAVLPATVGCIVGLPIGIWSLIVLNRDGVKAAFARKRGDVNEAPIPRKPQASGDDALPERRRLRIQSIVRGPGTGLIFVGLLNLLPLVLVPAILVVPTFSDTLLPAPFMVTWPVADATTQWVQDESYADPPGRSQGFFFGAMLVPLLIGLPLSGALILGGWKMRQLELYWLAIIASVVAILPCHVGFILGLPIGLWSLAVLSRSDVRTAFRQHAAGELGTPVKGF
ncbi:MAG: protein kinase [Pirellulaceae bacterium]